MIRQNIDSEISPTSPLIFIVAIKYKIWPLMGSGLEREQRIGNPKQTC